MEDNSEKEQKFKESLEEARWRYTTNGLRAGERAYEYGLLVVKNSFLVAGGGLFFVPTMVTISEKVVLISAVWAGLLFGISVVVALIGNYIIHWNWSLLEKVYRDHYDIEKIYIREVYGFDRDNDELEKNRLSKGIENTKIWINRTFYAPHVLVAIYLLCLLAGFFNLYRAFGVVAV